MFHVNQLTGFGATQQNFVSFFDRGIGTFSDLNTSWSTSTHGVAAGPNVYRSTGKWYMEVTVGQVGQGRVVGIGRSDFLWNSFIGFNTISIGYGGAGGIVYNNSNVVTGGATWTTNDVIAVAFDMDNLRVYFAKNNVWQFGGNPSAGTGGYAFNSGSWAPGVSAGGTAGSGTTSFIRANFGQWAKIYEPPTGYSLFQ